MHWRRRLATTLLVGLGYGLAAAPATTQQSLAATVTNMAGGWQFNAATSPAGVLNSNITTDLTFVEFGVSTAHCGE